LQFKSQWYSQAKKLKAIFNQAAGNDSIERDCKFHVPVTIGTFHGTIMAESILGMMFFSIVASVNYKKNQFAKVFDLNIESPIPLLRGQHVLIIGYGTIGKSDARTLKTYICKSTGFKRTMCDFDKMLVDQLITPESLIEKIGDADHVIAILPNTKLLTTLLLQVT
jgi:D-2-hydroxyacid dehydrogenase (NADP+)